MPDIGLNNLTSLAATTVGSQSAVATGSARGFDDYLQRAGGDGAIDPRQSGSSSDSELQDKTPSSGAGRDFHQAQSTDEGSALSPDQSPPSASDGQSKPTDDAGSAKNGRSSADREKRPASAPEANSQTPAAACVAVASGSVVGQASAPDATAVYVGPPTDAAPLVKAPGVGAIAKASDGNIPTVNPVDGQTAPTTNASDGAAAQSATTSATATDFQVQPTVVAANPAAPVTQAVATAGIAAVVKSTPIPSATKTSPQSSGPSVAASPTPDQPKPTRSERATGTDPRSAANSPATEIQIAAAGVVASGSGPDSQPADSSPNSNQKNGAPATEAVGAKSPPASAAVTTSDAASAPKLAPTSAPAVQSGSSSGASEVDRVRFIQRVAGAFQAADDQGGQIRIRLSPPELGSMRLEISVRNGLMTAHIQTESDTARNMLLDHLPQLRDRLADHNIKIDHFDVELSNQSRSGTPQNFAGNADQRLLVPSGNAVRSRAASGSEPTSASAGAMRAANGRLDVTV
jgi:flagellar hook-length control protein FliK